MGTVNGVGRDQKTTVPTEVFMKKLLAYLILTVTAITVVGIFVLGFGTMIYAAMYGDESAKFLLELIGYVIGSVLFIMALMWAIQEIDP